MKTGDNINGFNITDIRVLDEYDAEFVIMEHAHSGAQLMWIKRNEINKSFGISFKTVPEDDTGVFHILEHSVLNGSDKYPAREPFVELLKSSLNTFLNAMTYPDKTVYPVSSRNDRDFMNLIDVYLDAVFHPAIYKNPNIFRQEGWHMELHDGEESAIYKGVVFNEMKGALASPEDRMLLELQRLIYGNTCYGFESGGDPVSIPNLTYEKFIENHKKFYHPSNAKIFLDGNVNIDATLKLIDTYLAEKKKQEINFDIPIVECSAKENTVFYEISPDEETENRAYFAWGKTIGTWENKTVITAMKVLCDYLAGSNEAPVKKAVVGRGLAEDIELSLYDGIAQPYICVAARNAEEGSFDEIKKAVTDTIAEIVDKGIDRNMVNASISKLAFSALDMQEPSGLILGINSLSGWLYGGDPLYYLEYKEMFMQLRNNLDTDFYEKLMREFVPDDKTCCLIMLPSKEMGGIVEKEEKDRIEKRLAEGGDEYRISVIAETAELEAWQASPDSPEAIASIPQLEISEISREPIRYDVIKDSILGTEVWRHTVEASGIGTICMYFDMSDVKLTDLPRAAFVRSLLGKLPTKKHSAMEIQTLMKMHVGKSSFASVVTTDTKSGVTTPRMTVTFSALHKELPEAAKLITEILLETDFSKYKEIKEMLAQTCTDLKRSLSESGHSTAMTRASSNFGGEAAFAEYSGNISAFDILSDFNDNFDTEKEAFQNFAEEFVSRVAVKNRLILSVTGKVENGLCESIISSIPEGMEVEKSADLATSFPQKEGIIIPAGISYACMVNDYRKLGFEYNGAMQVLSSFLTYEYLWNEVRVKGGAYGTGIRFDTKGGVQFYSYRDPNAAASLNTYRSAGQFVKEFFADGNSAEKYIIGTIGSTEPVVSPADSAAIADRFLFRGMSYEDRKLRRIEMLETKAEDIIALAELLEKAGESANICIVGSKSIIDACESENLKVRNITD